MQSASNREVLQTQRDVNATDITQCPSSIIPNISQTNDHSEDGCTIASSEKNPKFSC